MNLSQVIEELIEERGLDKSILSSIVCEGMLAAFERKYPDLTLQAQYDQKTGEVNILVQKKVVTTVEDDLQEVSLKKARFVDKDLQLGDTVWLPFEGKIGRIEILRAKQVIASRIRKIESSAVYEEFKDKLGEVIHGTIHKCERGGVVVKIGENLAFLPKSLCSPQDKCIVGLPIRALVKEVLEEPRNDNQIILDRASEEFLKQLLELEIPEIFEKIVEIKKIVRMPGYKSKVIVASNDPNVDPVGTCIGVEGSRIKPILKELNNEKIDVISWSEDPETLVKNALKPAQIDRVDIQGDTAKVWLDEDQRAIAIGKMGQNIALASRLTGYNIQLSEKESEADTFLDEAETGESSEVEE